MKIADYSYHELSRVWKEDHYELRTHESFVKLLDSTRHAFETMPLKTFLRPYMWKPSGQSLMIPEKQLVETTNWMKEKEVRLWMTTFMYNPNGKYGETFESPMFEFNGVDLVKNVWDLLHLPTRRFPPFLLVRIDLE